MKKQSIKLLISCLVITIACESCKKGWLDEKPIKTLVIPHTLRDYKSLMAGTTDGAAFNIDYGTLTEHSAGDFNISPTTWTNGKPNDRNFYSWRSDLWADNTNYFPWTGPYQKILYTNVVLEGIETLNPTNNAEKLDWNQVKGSALFFRACWHYDVAKQFCKPYNKVTASADLGIPLRLNADFNEVSVRSTIKQTYDQITSDLKQSAGLFPITTPINDIYKCQPTTTAAYAMLARVYLAMSEYDSALLYADKTLQLYNTLLDYNTASGSSTPTASAVALTGNTPFARFNNEVIFHMRGATYAFLQVPQILAEPSLLNSYDINDWRRTLFFRTVAGNISLKASYDQTNTLWTGLGTDEIYLIRAECFARKGNKDSALNYLNTLLVKRWKTGSFNPITATDANDALAKILAERRKELCFRSIRWTDLKRLNMEPQFAVTLTKVIVGQTYTLQPNSNSYVFSIPPNVIELTGMNQNPR